MSEKPGTGTDQAGVDAASTPVPMSNDDAAAMAAAKDRKKRRAHKRHGGHEELNITAMLDLMTIILVFLMKQWQNEAITLSPEVRPPGSTITEKPSECVRIFVTKDKLLLDDKEVAAVDRGEIVPNDLDPQNQYLIPRLKAAMEDKAGQFLKIENAGGTKFEGRYAIVADRKVTWSLLKKLMFTAGQSAVVDQDGIERAFGDVRLVTKKSGE